MLFCIRFLSFSSHHMHMYAKAFKRNRIITKMKKTFWYSLAFYLSAAVARGKSVVGMIRMTMMSVWTKSIQWILGPSSHPRHTLWTGRFRIVPSPIVPHYYCFSNRKYTTLLRLPRLPTYYNHFPLLRQQLFSIQHDDYYYENILIVSSSLPSSTYTLQYYYETLQIKVPCAIIVIMVFAIATAVWTERWALLCEFCFLLKSRWWWINCVENGFAKSLSS